MKCFFPQSRTKTSTKTHIAKQSKKYPNHRFLAYTYIRRNKNKQKKGEIVFVAGRFGLTKESLWNSPFFFIVSLPPTYVPMRGEFLLCVCTCVVVLQIRNATHLFAIFWRALHARSTNHLALCCCMYSRSPKPTQLLSQTITHVYPSKIAAQTIGDFQALAY